MAGKKSIGPDAAGDVVTDAALHALGALPAADGHDFQERLGRGHAVANAEYHTFRLVADQLLEAAPAITPPPGLRERLMNRVSTIAPPQPAPEGQDPREAVQIWRRWSETPGGGTNPAGLFSLSADAGAWEKTAIEGIEVRSLFADREQHRVTMMVRMAPGTAYPTHRHAGAEECYVLQGDLRVTPAGEDRTADALHLHEGDYQRADASSIHGIQSTDTGCLLLIVSSTDDELIEG